LSSIVATSATLFAIPYPLGNNNKGWGKATNQQSIQNVDLGLLCLHNVHAIKSHVLGSTQMGGVLGKDAARANEK